MEEELRMFKIKIAYRFENAQIPKDYTFPRKLDLQDIIDKYAVNEQNKQSNQTSRNIN